jgi:hypothetical protein
VERKHGLDNELDEYHHEPAHNVFLSSPPPSSSRSHMRLPRLANGYEKRRQEHPRANTTGIIRESLAKAYEQIQSENLPDILGSFKVEEKGADMNPWRAADTRPPW